MKKIVFTSLVALALAAGFITEAMAQSANFQVSTRRGAMQLQGKYLFPIFAMVQGRAPYDAAIVQRNADYLAVLTQLAWDDFQPSTMTATVANKAKEDIYKDPVKFKAKADAVQAEVKKLAVAAKAGDQAAVGAAAKSVGGACNSCHEAFSTYEFRFKVE